MTPAESGCQAELNTVEVVNGLDFGGVRNPVQLCWYFSKMWKPGNNDKDVQPLRCVVLHPVIMECQKFLLQQMVGTYFREDHVNSNEHITST